MPKPDWCSGVCRREWVAARFVRYRHRRQRYARLVILWPCIATLPDGSIRSPVKVFTNPGEPAEVWEWRDRPRPAQAEVLASGPLCSTGEDHVYSLDSGKGDVRIVVDARSCGCGHPLKFFRPGGIGPTRAAAYAPIL